MAEAFGEEGTVECGFCLSSEDSLIDPKSLPCSHVHCMECLTAAYGHSGLVQCPLPSCRSELQGIFIFFYK